MDWSVVLWLAGGFSSAMIARCFLHEDLNVTWATVIACVLISPLAPLCMVACFVWGLMWLASDTREKFWIDKPVAGKREPW